MSSYSRHNPAINPTKDPLENLTIDQYPGIFGDFDGDGIPNVDDPNPLQPGDSETVEEVSLRDEIKELIEIRKEYTGALKQVMGELERIKVQSSVKGRVKTPFSIINKLRRKRLKAKIESCKAGEFTKGLTDMAGCMIIVDDYDDLKTVLSKIKDGKLGKIFEHENFYTEPLNGYRAHHFIVLANVNGNEIPVEVQAKTVRMAAISAGSHEAYKAGLLNSDEMLRLTDMAVKADKGNKKTQKELDTLLNNKEQLEGSLTLRNNPLSDAEYEAQVKELRDGYAEIVAMYKAAFKAGRIPDEFKGKLKTQIEKYGETLGVTEPIEQSKKTSSSDTYLRTKDLELRETAPIKLTRTERKKINEKVIGVLEKQDSEIVESDIELLRQYTGAGGVEYASDEYKRGKMNEHYTSYPLIKMMWDKLERMGVQDGNFLEPGSGIGNFAGFIPERLRYKMVMVEKSPISSRIASILFPQQTVVHNNFADVDTNRYNLNGAIGNVPFGNIKVHTRRDPLADLKPNIHDYFILKSIDSVAPGSPIALITSTGTMDKKDSKIRKAITKRARLVASYRLPSTSFKDNADTSVTTDLLILQKYPDTNTEFHEDVEHPANKLFAYSGLSKSTLEHKGETYNAFYNPYYDEFPEHILGEHIQGHDVQFFSRMGVKGEMSKEVIRNVLHDGIKFPYDLPKTKELYRSDDGIHLELLREYNSGSLIYHEGSFYKKQNFTFEPVTVPKSDTQRIKSACLLLDTYADYVRALAQGTDRIEQLRNEFKAATDSHIEHFGVPDEDENLRKQFQHDSRLYKLTSFVKTNPMNGELKFADIYTAESMYNKQYVPKLSDSSDISELAMFGNSIGADLDMDFYQSVFQGGTATKEEAETALSTNENFFWNPESENYEFKYEYLSGDVRHKLRIAEQEELDENIKALEAIVPEKISVYKIGLTPRHIFTYLPPDAIGEWLKDTLGYGKVEVGLVKDKAGLGNRFYMDFKRGGIYAKRPTEQDSNLGFGNEPYSKIVLNYITDRTFPLNFYDENDNLIPGMTLKRAKEQNRDGLIERARKKQRENKNRMLTKIPKDFENWVRVNANPELVEKIETAYNNKYNSVVNPDFDGGTIRFRGMSNTFYGEKNFKVYKHNRAVAEKMIWNGRGANCHDVGAGKTMSAIITNQTLLQQGSVKKPMFVVPGKVQEKWIEEYTQLFPDAKLLNLKFADSESRYEELAMAQLYDWDAIFISANSFKRLPLSPDVQSDLLQERIAYFDDMIENFGDLIEEDAGISSQAKKSMIKRLEAQKESFEQNLRDLSAIQRTDTDIYFDELGVDGLFVDEAHFYKNALGSAKAQKLGIAATKPSQRAEDMIQKSQWLFSKIGYRNVYLLTATPVVNSPVEVWHMLQLCAPDMLEENDIHALDNFINLFVKEENKIVKKTTGEYKEEMVVAGYYNLPEMRRVIDNVMDIKSYDQLQQFYVDHPEYVTDNNGEKSLLKPSFKRPAANYSNEIVKPSRIHEMLFEDIILRAEQILADMADPNKENKDNFLVITGDGSRIATDLRIYDPNFTGFNHASLKVQELIPNVIESYQQVRSNPASAVAEQKMLPATDWDENLYGNFFQSADQTRVRSNPSTDAIRNQIIFCDFITTKDGKSFHGIIKEQLKSKGIPANEIAIINGNTIGTTGKKGKDRPVKASDDKEVFKKEVQDDFNAGKFRVLIGNKSIAEGMNLQRWTTDIHHLDVPYTPSEIQQRNGRGLRQGNKYDSVNISYYLMQDSFDQYRLELVNKKQGWIDQLFYGDKREVDSDDQAQSLNYEEMVSATTSDPEIKKFFQAKASLKKLDTRISTLEAEKQRIEGSLVQAKRTVDLMVKKLETTTEKEKALKDTPIPFGYEDVEKIISNRDVVMSRLYGFDTSKLSFTIDANITESRHFSNMQVNVKLEVPKTNQNGRVYLRISPPSDRTQTNRSMFTRTSWKGLKMLGRNELTKVFPNWEDRAYKSDTFDLIADETDFEEYYGYDLLTEKNENDDRTWDDIKTAKRMYDSDRWKPVIERKIVLFMLALEKSWKQKADSRIELLKKTKDERTKKVEQLETELSNYTKELSESESKLITNQELVDKLIDKVKELTATEYSSRYQLYEDLNAIAPEYGVDRIIPIREIGSFKVNESINDDENVEALLRENPNAKFIYIGICDKIFIDQGNDDPVELQGQHAMLTNKTLNKLFIVPFDLIDDMPNGIQDEKAEDIYEMWHNYNADDSDMTLQWSEDDELKPVGTADSIFYISDKIMREDDKKGKMHMYHHDFDKGKRSAFVKGNTLIVSNLKIDERGILN